MLALLPELDDPTGLPAWLTAHLLGPELPVVVAELRAHHRPGRPPPLDAVLGPHRAAFLNGGFNALPRDVLAQLLRNPDLLLALPDLVYAEGGPVWFADPPAADEHARATAVADRVRAALLAEPHMPARSLRWLSYAGVSVATAAAVLLAVWVGGGFRTSPPPPSGWGFAKIQQVPRGEPKATFTALAGLSDEWGNKPTDTREALAKRLSEFRLGCSTLQATDLGLPPADADWLKARCLDWSAALDRHLRDLDETGDVPAVRAAATQTVAGIAAALRARAG